MIQLGLADAMRDMARPEARALNARDEVFAEWVTTDGAAHGTAGVPVTASSARTIAAYTNAITMISQDVGLLDRYLYKRVGEDGDRERAVGHPVWRVVHDAPNPDTTPMIFWQTMMAHVLGWGNAYAEIEWSTGMIPLAMWIITPDRVTPKVETVKDARGRKRSRVYYMVDGQRIESEDILHLRGLSFDGVQGYSVVQAARRSLGLTMAMETYGAAFFENGAWVGLALEHPGKLSEDAKTRIRSSVDLRHGGPSRAGRTIVLSEGMRVSKPLTLPPEDGQWLESREFSVVEMARWFNLPPRKLKLLGGTAPTTPESEQIEYTTGTLLPWTVNIDQELNRKLVNKQPTFFVEHEFRRLLKTDSKTRSEIQQTYVDMGALDPDQVAQQENLPKPKPKETAPAPASAMQAPADPVPEAVRAAASAVLHEAVARMVRKEANAARRAAEGGTARFGAWLVEFYERHEPAMAEAITPAVRMCLALAGGEDPVAAAARVTRRHVAASRSALEDVKASDLPKGVERVVSRWEADRPAQLGDELRRVTVTEDENDEHDGQAA